jgi:hypothetical protein
MAYTDKQDVKDLLVAARSTRNYCMLTGRSPEASNALIDALAPFDGDHEAIELENLTALRKAMREVCRGIDDYTLTKILDGDPPVRIGPLRNHGRSDESEGDIWSQISARITRLWPPIWQRLVLPGTGILFLVLAMHYTHWSLNANILLSKLEDHLHTNVQDEIRDLIVVAQSIDKLAGEAGQPDPNNPAQKLFDQSLSKLTAYHFTDVALRAEAATSRAKFDAIVAATQFVKAVPLKVFQPAPRPLSLDGTEMAEGKGAHTTGSVILSGKNVADPPATPASLQKDIVDAAKIGATDIGPQQPTEVAFKGNERFREFVEVVAERTRRDPNANASYEEARLQLAQSASALSAKIAIANRWALPVLYGSLGAALFCLVRVLTPALSDLGPGRAFLRILFGAFAAMTLSMLFIPANVFAINAQSNSTLIFLACFLFGYSFDAVLAALGRLERFLQGRLKAEASERV